MSTKIAKKNGFSKEQMFDFAGKTFMFSEKSQPKK